MYKMIVGLGNPEDRFKRNRHNIGFMLIDALVDHYKAQDGYFRAPRKPLVIMLKQKIIHRQVVTFVKPQDWMNSSGKAVGLIKRTCGYDPKDIMVIHDDMDFEFGKIKIKSGGSSGRHNGIQSVIDAIGKDFTRFRVGIGRPDDEQTARDYVLSDFRTFEQKQFCELFGLAIQVVDTFVAHGVQQTMNIFNRREVDDRREDEEA